MTAQPGNDPHMPGPHTQHADTIAAIASPPGRAHRALVRVDGPAVARVLDAIVSGAPPARSIAPARLRWTAQLELPVLVTRFVAPASATGADACEIQLPGNPALAQLVLARVLAVPGVRLAQPGEFSARAYLAGRLTLDQAEGVAAAIAAASTDELDAARALLAGTTGDRYRAWTDRAADLLALVEAGIDFADQEDVVAIEPEALRARLASLLSDLDAELGGHTRRPVPSSQPLVVLVGPPSAGKSTLFNALLGRPRAVTDAAPGTTRDALIEDLPIAAEHPGAGPIRLADLPGLDAATPSRPASVARVLDDASVWVLCDPHGRFELPMPQGRRQTIRVRTKADLVAPEPSTDTLAVCALDGWNLGPLRRAIADAACAAGSSPLVVVPRHRRALDQARDALAEADRCAAGPAQPDPAILASHLRRALDELGSITGCVSPDDVIGRVFATFCVGK